MTSEFFRTAFDCKIGKFSEVIKATDHQHINHVQDVAFTYSLIPEGKAPVLGSVFMEVVFFVGAVGLVSPVWLGKKEMGEMLYTMDDKSTSA